MRRSIAGLAAAVVAAVLLVGCGGDGGTGPGPTPSRSMSPSAGDNQTARISSAVPVPPAVIVRDGNNQPVAGVSVTFAVETGGGSITGATVTTNASGVAAVGGWTLGSAPGPNTLTATASGVTGSPVRFTATARLPYWTVMVYMAADNNLAIAGIFDIDEMEAAGLDPEVQVLVQAEFNPTQLGLYGCDASCFNRPNFNTFRYILAGAQPEVIGPNGTATDLGNRNMTLSSELREFVLWAKQTAPAEHYALVLWNHGGGYTGLLQDETSAGSALMPVSALRTALMGVGPIDIMDFDMCLMAGEETLYQIRDLASYAVFSEELVPGEGNPYQGWLDTLQARAAGAPAAVAGALVEAFHASYQGNRASTTRSAYALAAYGSFEAALNNLAGVLRTNLPSLQGAIASALQGAQKYEYAELTDLVTFLDSLRVRVGDAGVQSAIDNVKAQATAAAFRLRNRARNGTAVGFGGENDVARSTGLHIVLPSGVDEDRFADQGERSFTAYQALYPGRAWTLFLADWTAAQTAVAYTDQGALPFQGFLVWDEASVALNADVDLWILEPNGNLYIPWLGSVTPNGTLTNDSYEDGTWFEGYLTNRFIENGRYGFYAHLYQDPADYRPPYDLQYRNGFTDPLTSLYAPNYPQLSLQVSWLNDPDPTFTEVEAGAYTDLQYVAFLDIGAPAPLAVSRPDATPTVVLRAAPMEPTPAQLDRVRRALTARNPATEGRLFPTHRVPSGLRAVPR